MLSGLNLAVFSVSRLRLEAAAAAGDGPARRVLALRRDSNLTLATILWGNVAFNVLLTLLADSLLTGVAAFVFSTVLITFGGEILPQAYFARNALRLASFFAPVLGLYRILLWTVAKPVGRLLDAWVGPRVVPWFREQELHEVLRHHALEPTSEISRLEATGAMNFLALDDLAVGEEGEPLDPRCVVRLPFEEGRPVFPTLPREGDDPFLRKIGASGRKWMVVIDDTGEPRLVFSAPAMLREALYGGDAFDPRSLCHRPLVVRDAAQPFGRVLDRLVVKPEHPGDDVIDVDVVLVWTEAERRIITGSDILGRLLRRIAQTVPSTADRRTR